MIRSIAALLLCLTVTSAAYCQKNIQLSGKISNPVSDNVIVVNATNTYIVPPNKQDKLMLDSNGSFKITIPVTEQYNWIILVHNNQRMDFYAEAGSDLQMTASGTRFDTTVHFMGSGMDIPNYFAAAVKDRGGIMAYYGKLQQMAQREPVNYGQGLDSAKMQEQAIYDIAVKSKKYKLPKGFTAFWHSFLEYSVYDAMLNYPLTHQMILKQPTELQNIPKPLFDIPAQVPAKFDDNNLDIPFYQTYLQTFYGNKLSAAGFSNQVRMNPDGTEDRSKALQQTDSVLKLIYKNMPPATAAFAAGRIISTESKTWALEDLETRVAGFKSRFPKSGYNAELEKVVKELKKFYPGQPAVDFTFKTLDGKDMKLSDLKGKVVYMDFWASWCGPCKGEMPFAKKIKEHFKDNPDVVFLYVSIDDKEEAWKRGIDALGISGMHTRTPGWGGEIAQLYKIQSVPSYFLFDKKGNFAVKKTPRPSQTDEVIRLIEGLL